MLQAGAHFGFSRTRRHPSVLPYIFGVKNRVEIFDLEKTGEQLEAALAFVEKLGGENKKMVLVGSKNEARDLIKEAAEILGLPYVTGRWVGGTLTNFGEIRKRVERMLELAEKREAGELAKYTKKERLLIDREIVHLESLFSGLVGLKEMPGAMFVVDPREEKIAVREAEKKGVPVVALCGSDCDISRIAYSVPANDASRSSISYFVGRVTEAYKRGQKAAQSSLHG